MKKQILSIACLGLLAGCANTDSAYSTRIENADKVAVSGSNISITNQDVYETLMDSYGANYVLNKAMQFIAQDYEVDEEALKKEVETTINSYKTFYGEDLDKYAKENLGYESFEQYQQEILVPSLRQQQMLRSYADNNFDTLSAQYHFKKLRMIVVESESEAISLISKLSNEEITFEKAFEEHTANGLNSSNTKGELGIVSDLSKTSSVDQAILTVLPQFKVNGIYSVPISLASGKGYAVIDIMESDVAKMQSEVATILRESDAVMAEAEIYFLKEHGLKIFDPALEANIKALNPDYIQ